MRAATLLAAGLVVMVAGEAGAGDAIGDKPVFQAFPFLDQSGATTAGVFSLIDDKHRAVFMIDMANRTIIVPDDVDVSATAKLVIDEARRYLAARDR